MNDTERELKELLESKASEARIAPVAPPTVLKRGRKRQVGTALIAAGTTLVVVVGSILGVQGLLRDNGATSLPASTQPVTTRTALIQGLTVTSPSDWTLTDDWPVSALIAVKGSSSKFSAAGCPIEAGSGNSSRAATCPTPVTAQAQTSPTPDPSGLPVFQLSNFDPGLTRSLCGDGVMRGNEVSLYVGLITGPVAIAAPDSGSSFDVSSPPEDGPCGSGSYATITSGDAVYLAFAGFGADVSDTDRQQVLDTFNGLSPVAPGIGLPKITTPGYVVAGGASASGEPWRIEVRPSEEQSSPDPFEMTLVHGDGAKSEHFTFGDVSSDSIAWGNSGGLWYGAVPSDTTSLEFQPNDGSDSTPAQLFDLPSSLNVSALGFVLSVPEGVDGQLTGSTPTSGFAIGSAVAVGPSPVNEPPTGRFTDVEAKALLAKNFIEAEIYFGNHNSTYEGFTPEVASSLEPHTTFNSDPTATPGEVSIRDVTSTTILLVTVTSDGQPYCRAASPALLDGYGLTDAQTADACAGPPGVWGTTSATDAASLPGRQIASGTDLGTDWALSVDSHSVGYFGLPPFTAKSKVFAIGMASPDPSAFSVVSAPGGAFFVGIAPSDSGAVSVSLPDGSVIDGRSYPIPDDIATGETAWVLALPSSGTGTVVIGSAPTQVRINWQPATAGGT